MTFTYRELNPDLAAVFVSKTVYILKRSTNTRPLRPDQTIVTLDHMVLCSNDNDFSSLNECWFYLLKSFCRQTRGLNIESMTAASRQGQRNISSSYI